MRSPFQLKTRMESEYTGKMYTIFDLFLAWINLSVRYRIEGEAWDVRLRWDVHFN